MERQNLSLAEIAQSWERSMPPENESDTTPEIIEAHPVTRLDGSTVYAASGDSVAITKAEYEALFPSQNSSEVNTSHGVSIPATVARFGGALAAAALPYVAPILPTQISNEITPIVASAEIAALQEIEDIPSITLTIKGGANVRSLPSTNSDILHPTSADLDVLVHGQISADDGSWLYIQDGENNGWVRIDTIKGTNTPDGRANIQSQVDTLWNLETIGAIPLLDNDGNPTESTLLSASIEKNLSEVAFFVRQIEPAFPEHTFSPESIGVLASGESSVVFMQTVDIPTPEKGVDAKNEAGSILAFKYAAEENPVFTFVAPGQLREVFNEFQIPGDFSNARFSGEGAPEGFLRFGQNVLFDWELSARSATAGASMEESLANAAIVVEGELPTGQFTVTPDAIQFANVQFSIKGQNVDNTQPIRTATPEAVEVALAPGEVPLNPEYFIPTGEAGTYILSPEAVEIVEGLQSHELSSFTSPIAENIMQQFPQSDMGIAEQKYNNLGLFTGMFKPEQPIILSSGFVTSALTGGSAGGIETFDVFGKPTQVAYLHYYTRSTEGTYKYMKLYFGRVSETEADKLMEYPVHYMPMKPDALTAVLQSYDPTQAYDMITYLMTDADTSYPQSRQDLQWMQTVSSSGNVVGVDNRMAPK